MTEKHKHNIGNLVKRLDALEEERAILRTLYRYGHCVDYGLEQEWVDLFAEDGVFIVRGRVDRTERIYRGRESLAQFVAGHSRAPAKYHKHLSVAPVITFGKKNSASVESYSVRLDESEGRAYVSGFGRYRDRLVKQNGQWRFQERVLEIEVFSPRPFGG